MDVLMHAWPAGAGRRLRRSRATTIAAAAGAAIWAAPLHAATWAGGSSFWDLVTNWDPVGVPAPTDAAVIDVDGTHTVSVRKSATIASIVMAGDETLAVNAPATLTVNGDALLNRLHMTGGLAGSGIVNVLRGGVLGGSHLGVGTTSLQGGTFVLDGPMNFDATRGFVNGTQSTIEWRSGKIGLVIGFAAPDSTVLQNKGRIVASGDGLGILVGRGKGGVDNTGLVRRENGTAVGLTNFESPFHNRGRVEAATGTIAFSGGGLHSGLFDVAAGATLGFWGGIHQFAAGASFIGAGRTVIDGTIDFQPLVGLTVPNLRQLSGTVSGPGRLALTGKAELVGGVHQGDATTFIQAAAELVHPDGGSFALDRGRTLRIGPSGRAKWLGGNLNLDLSQAAPGGGLLYIEEGGELAFTGSKLSRIVTASGGQGRVNNDGRLFLRAGSSDAEVSIEVPLDNRRGAFVGLESGLLYLRRDGEHAGAWLVTPGSKLSFAGGNHVLRDGTTFGGAGVVALEGTATLRPEVDLTVSRFLLDGGTLAGPGNWSISKSATFGSGLQIGPGRTIVADQGKIIGDLRLDQGRVLEIGSQGIVAWGWGKINLNADGAAGSGTGQLLNKGILLIVGDGAARIDGSPGYVLNAGIIVKKESTAPTSVYVPVHNDGVIGAESGTLRLLAGGLHKGYFQASAGASIEFGGGAHEFEDGFTGAGWYRVTGGSFEPATGVTLPRLHHTAGLVTGPGALTVTEEAIFELGAKHEGPTTTTIRGKAEVRAGGMTLDNGRKLHLEKGSHLTWVAGNINLNGPDLRPGTGTLLNEGTILMRGDMRGARITRSYDGAAQFNNLGDLTKLGSSDGDVVYIDVPFANGGRLVLATGQIHVGGFVNSGLIRVGGPLGGKPVLKVGGTLVNLGTIDGTGGRVDAPTVLNHGTFSPGNSIGHLSLHGNLEQATDGQMLFELAAPGANDTLDVEGRLLLAGRLRIEALDGWRPADGQRFTLITADDAVAGGADISGRFGELIWSGFGRGVGFTLDYAEHEVVLRAAVTAVPEPSSAWLHGIGLAVVACAWRRRRR
jgi:hypothetical protein